MNRTWMITGVLLVLALLIWRNFRLQEEFDRLAAGLEQLRDAAQPVVAPESARVVAPPPKAAAVAPDVDLVLSLREAQAAIKALSEKNENLEKEKLDLEKQVASLTASLTRSQAALSTANAEKTRVEPASRGVEKRVEALTIQQAEVLNVNKNLSMMVLNVGERQGVKPGMHFKILRNDIVIGRAQAVDVRREVCGALLNGDQENWPQRGDRAIPGKNDYGS